MSWDAFQFSCRFLSKKLSEGLDLDTGKHQLFEKYRELFAQNPLDNEIYKGIISNGDKKRQMALFSIYGQLNLNWDLSAIDKLTNVRNYLYLLICAFVLLSAICVVYVFPAISNLFYISGLSTNDQNENFIYYWTASCVLIAVTCVGIFKYQSVVRSMSRKLVGFTPTIFSRLVLGKEIIVQIHKIEALKTAPLNYQLNQFSEAFSKLIEKWKSDELNVSMELQTVVDNEHQNLNRLLNKRTKLLMTVLAFIIIMAIFNFVYSLYLPLFYIGNI